MTIRALLFDLDNTLYHYTPCDEAALVATRAVLAQHINLSDAEFGRLNDQVRSEFAARLGGQAASHSRILFFKSMVEQLTTACGGDLALRMSDRYWEAFLGQMEPAPHTRDVLESLGGSHDLALVTNQTTYIQLRKIQRLGIERHFPVVVTSEECGVEKPDARVFQRALSALGVDAADAVMIGDDPDTDIRGASELGISTVHTTEFTGARLGEEQVGAGPDAVIGSLSELPEVLSRLS